MSETVKYKGKLPLTEQQIVEWMTTGYTAISVDVELHLSDLIGSDGWDGMNDYMDEAIGTSLTDLDYRVHHIQTGQRDNDAIVLRVTGNFDAQTLWQSETLVKFSPEAWQNDYAVPVDPQGDDTWAVADATLDLIADAKKKGRDLDFVMLDPFAPQWVKNWGGPFTITVLDDQA